MRLRDRVIRIGSRGSELALWQTNWIKQRLEARFPGMAVEVTVIKTTGDRILDTQLSKIGDKGLFIKEIEHALLTNDIDLAVHSLKDVPTSIPEGLSIGAVTQREDPRDVFVGHPSKNYETFADLPQQASIATGSLRRRCQLLHWRPDLQIVDVRGNLNTRLRKLEDSDWDGMVLAKAGIVRLGLEARITEVLPLKRLLPAVGQGALALEIRETDTTMGDVVRWLNHEPTAIAAKGERALLRTLEGGCQIPIGAYGRIENGQFILDAVIGTVDGKTTIRGRGRGTPEQVEECGRALAETLVEGGARKILDEIREKSSVATPAV